MLKRPWSTAFIDFLLCTVILLFLAIGVKPKDNSTSRPLADYTVWMQWTNGLSDDVDIYLLTPDRKVLYFRNHDLGYASINRDDLGSTGEYSPLNLEVMSLTALPDGVYYITIHGYKIKPGDVGEVVLEFTDQNGISLAAAHFPLPKDNEEIPVWKFEVVNHQVGKIVRDDVLIRKAGLP